MEKGFGVKTTVYIGPNGEFVRDISNAQLYKDKELAESAAVLAHGFVTEVIRPARKPRVVKPIKANQSWMKRGGS